MGNRCAGRVWDFNSIKVRLRPSEKANDIVLDLFQFHKGSIKTSTYAAIRSDILYFNSIKVRLRHRD